MSTIANGELAGKRIEEIIKSYQTDLLGEKYIENSVFPIMIKILDANDKLSI
jgi:mannose-6-phosphate isomerase